MSSLSFPILDIFQLWYCNFLLAHSCGRMMLNIQVFSKLLEEQANSVEKLLWFNFS
jgi:hypothetical protein